jgi:hypothetical protein
MGRPLLEVADIFRAHGPAFRIANAGHVSLGQLKVMSAIETCRTAALGGHVERCEDCGLTRVAYNSCRNRHCPKCQAAAAKQWLAEREAELLPVPYYHVVFTLPAAIGAMALQNKAVVYDLLFKAAAETLTTIAADPKIWAPASASPPCCTPGARRSPIIPTSTSSSPAAACRPTASAGSPAGKDSSCRCACSRACSAASFSMAWRRYMRPAGWPFSAISRRSRTTLPSRPRSRRSGAPNAE